MGKEGGKHLDSRHQKVQIIALTFQTRFSSSHHWHQGPGESFVCTTQFKNFQNISLSFHLPDVSVIPNCNPGYANWKDPSDAAKCLQGARDQTLLQSFPPSRKLALTQKVG